MKPTIPRGSGFTLIELLVAVAIFGVLSVTAYAGLNRLLDERAALEHEREYWRDLSLLFVRLGDDLAHARDRPVRDNAGIDTLPALRGQPTDPRALGEPELEFTRGGEPDYGSGRRSDLRRVAWRLREGRLERLTWPVLDRGPVTAPIESPVLGGVEAFELRFLAQTGGTSTHWPALGGTTTQPSGAPNVSGPPRAVEVSVTMKGRARYTRLFLVGE
jgi:general secretion pathway protein J